jgi:hypothetical protein
VKSHQHSFVYNRNQFPSLKTHPPPQKPTWAQVTAQHNTPNTTTSPTSITDSIKSILSLFDFPKLVTQLRTLTTQLQQTSDPISKLVVIIDTFVSCLAPTGSP